MVHVFGAASPKVVIGKVAENDAATTTVNLSGHCAELEDSFVLSLSLSHEMPPVPDSRSIERFWATHSEVVWSPGNALFRMKTTEYGASLAASLSGNTNVTALALAKCELTDADCGWIKQLLSRGLGVSSRVRSDHVSSSSSRHISGDRTSVSRARAAQVVVDRVP